MQNRAYSVLNVKAVDDAARVIRGVATSPTVDRVGDIIEPLGMQFTNPMPFLWQHKHDKPIGTVVFDKPTAAGIGFEATIAHPDSVESEVLKERLREAWDSMRIGLVRAVSVGFRPIEYSYMDEGGVRFIKSECYELSAVTIGANSDALINEIKSIDAALRKAAGVSDPEVPVTPKGVAASGKSVRVVKLDDPARDRAPPFVVRDIKRLT